MNELSLLFDKVSNIVDGADPALVEVLQHVSLEAELNRPPLLFVPMRGMVRIPL